MSDELRLKGIGVAPGVLETIATLATESCEGVAAIEGGGLVGLVQKGAARGVQVTVSEEGNLAATVHVSMKYGQPLHEVAAKVQQAVAEALASQTGQTISSVDVFVDGVVFEE